MSTHYNGTELSSFRVAAFLVYGGGHSPLSPAGPSPFPNWPLPLPLPRREGAWSPRYPYKKDVGFALSLIIIENSSNVLWYLYAGGVLWTRNAGGKILLNLWVLWEKEIPSMRERNTLCARKHSPPCEKELPKKSWCKEIKSPKAYLKTIPPLPQFKNMLFSMREHAL